MSKNKTRRLTEKPAGRRGVIDQIEEGLATIVFDDNNEQLVVKLETLPPDAHVGDVVTINPPTANASAQGLNEGAAAPTIEVDSAETEAAKERVRNLIDDIFKKQT